MALVSKNRLVSFLSCVLLLVLAASILTACGSQEVPFVIKHISDRTGETITEVVSYQTEPGLDNSNGTETVQVQIQFERGFRYIISESMNTNEVPVEKVKDRIVELYKLPVNDPEDTLQRALCPVSVFIPAGKKAVVTVEWTERWVEGIINEGADGSGDRLGTYRVFLGYIEPCSLVNQENVD